jgi:hypothetical protein
MSWEMAEGSDAPEMPGHTAAVGATLAAGQFPARPHSSGRIGNRLFGLPARRAAPVQRLE